MFLILHIRNGNPLCIWKVPADTFSNAVFWLKQFNDHEPGDSYQECRSPITRGTVPRRV